MALATAQRLEVDEWTVRCRICSSGNDDEHHIQYHAQRINFLPEIEKRLDINHTIYPGSGNYSQFTFDGYGHIVKIVEMNGGSVTSTKQFVWAGQRIRESRDASGAAVNQYFSLGQTASGNNYFYHLNHLGNVVGVANSGGSSVCSLSYDSYGRPTVLSGTFMPDFGFAGLYLHQRSGLSLAVYRAYNSTTGRWISRDPIEEDGGVNLYAYLDNKPLTARDPLGTFRLDDGGSISMPPLGPPVFIDRPPLTWYIPPDWPWPFNPFAPIFPGDPFWADPFGSKFKRNFCRLPFGRRLWGGPLNGPYPPEVTGPFRYPWPANDPPDRYPNQNFPPIPYNWDPINDPYHLLNPFHSGNPWGPPPGWVVPYQQS